MALGEVGDDAVAKSIEAVEVATSTLREKAGTLAARSADLANLLDAALEADACAFPSPRRKPGPSANAPSATATSLRQRTGPNRTLPQGSLTCVSSSFILGSPPDEPAHTPEVRDREASQAARLLRAISNRMRPRNNVASKVLIINVLTQYPSDYYMEALCFHAKGCLSYGRFLSIASCSNKRCCFMKQHVLFRQPHAPISRKSTNRPRRRGAPAACGKTVCRSGRSCGGPHPEGRWAILRA